MRITLISILILTCMTFVCTAEEVQMPPNEGPYIQQATGNDTVCLDATRYPEFYSYQSDNPTCGEYLKKEYNAGAVSGNQSNEGFSLAPLWLKSKYSGSPTKNPPASGNPGYKDVPGLSMRYEPKESYRKSANLLVTWTVRVEAYKHCGTNDGCNPISTAEYCDGDAYKIWPDLCDVWHGTSSQDFPGGEVKTALFINGVQKGSETVMTIPGGGSSSSYQPNDPTHTGSFLITPDSFPDKMLPATIHIVIKWYNDTSMKIKSPEKMRNLIITVVPREKITE